MSGRSSLRTHCPSLLKRANGRFEVHCEDYLARTDEDPRLASGLPVASKHEAVEMLRNHAGRAAWTTTPDAPAQTHRGQNGRGIEVRRTA